MEMKKYTPEDHDTYKIIDMVIYLGKHDQNPINPCLQSLKKPEDRYVMHYYTCKYLGLDGKCTNYENRPDYMCAGYGITYGTDLLKCALYNDGKQGDMQHIEGW